MITNPPTEVPAAIVIMSSASETVVLLLPHQISFICIQKIKQKYNAKR